MGQRRAGSPLIREVERAINKINRIGVSKREARAKGEHGLHSYKTIQNTLSVCMNFARWVREKHGVKRIGQLKEEHYHAYLHYKNGEGVSKGHLIGIETGLRHLQKGMNAVYSDLKKDGVHWVPKTRIYQSRDAERPKNRSYTLQQVQDLKRYMSPRVQQAVDLAVYLGLRERECVEIRAEHFEHREDGRLYVNIKEGRGITKGGRFREILVPVSYQPTIEKWLEEKKPYEKLVSLQAGTLRKGLKIACDKAGIPSQGFHGFRHTFARERMKGLLQQQLGDNWQKGQAMFQRVMQNRERGKDANYGIVSQHDKELWKDVRECMNIVHAELGHGRDRWDLAERYLY